jgi:hypothetical protein
MAIVCNGNGSAGSSCSSVLVRCTTCGAVGCKNSNCSNCVRNDFSKCRTCRGDQFKELSSSGGFSPLAAGMIGGLLGNALSEKNRSSENAREAREQRHREYLENVRVAEEAERKAAEEAEEEEASLREQLMSLQEERRALGEEMGLPQGKVRSVEELISFHQMLEYLHMSEEQFNELPISTQQYCEHVQRETERVIREMTDDQRRRDQAKKRNKFCTQCGQSIGNGANFCTYCGAKAVIPMDTAQH